jgi:hypothetical protein
MPIKSTIKNVICNSTIISFTLPKNMFSIIIRKYKIYSAFSIILSSSKSYNFFFDKPETLDRRSNIACRVSMPIVINILGIQAS